MKKKGILIGTILLVIIATIVTCFMMSGRNTLESHLKLAVKYFNEGNYEEAILEFDKAIKIDDKIFHIYLAKANAEIETGNNDAALESTIKMVELLKVNDEIANKTMLQAHTILLDMYNTSKYKEKEDLLIWFYEAAYGNEKYAEYLSWIEDYLPDEYDVSMEWIREEYSENMQEKYIASYERVLSSYKKALKNNFEYDYINGEEFEKVYPDVNSELAANGGVSGLKYSLTDINKDGVPELIIGNINNPTYDNINDDWCPDYVIWDIYGLENGNPKRIIDIYSVGYRRHYKLFDDGIIGCMSIGNGNENGVVISYDFYSVEGTSSVPVYALQSDTTIPGGKYTVGTSSPSEDISKSKYDSIMNSFVPKKDINWETIDYHSYENSNTKTSSEGTLTSSDASSLAFAKAKTKGELQGGPKRLVLESENDEQFTFKLCEDSPEKQTVINWYYVNKKTKEVTSMF